MVSERHNQWTGVYADRSSGGLRAICIDYSEAPPHQPVTRAQAETDFNLGGKSPRMGAALAVYQIYSEKEALRRYQEGLADRKDGWLPLEEARHNGSRMLLCVLLDGKRIVTIGWSETSGSERHWIYADSHIPAGTQPLRWQPIPPAWRGAA